MRLSLCPRFLVALAIVAGCSSFTPAQTSTRTASISGRVLIGGRPAFNKTVFIEPTDNVPTLANSDGTPADGVGVHSVKTDAEGRYRVTGLRPGAYQVSVRAGAYVSEKKAEQRLRNITLDEGETAEKVDFALVPGGVVTGRVTDAQGRPVIAQNVHLHPVLAEGQQWEPYDPPNSQATDDRGVYRIYGVMAGRYRLSAGGNNYGPFGRTTTKHALTYYPGTTDEKQAKIIEVKEGGELTEMDIRLGAHRSYTVAGRVIDAATDQPLAQVSLVCHWRGDRNSRTYDSTSRTITDAKGNFRLSGLSSGQYSLHLSSNFGMLDQIEYYNEGTRFEIKDADVSGVEVEAKPGATISGVVSNHADATSKINLAQLLLSAMVTRKEAVPDGADESAASVLTSGFTANKINSDGSFRITGLPPGKVRFELMDMSGRAPKIGRLERNGVELREGLEINAGEAVTGIRLALVNATGTIRGQVTITGGSSSAGWQIHASARRLDAASGDNNDASETGVGGKGRFVIEELLDGEYEVVVLAYLPGRNEAPPNTRQRIRIVNGGEVQVNLTLDLNKRDQEERQ